MCDVLQKMYDFKNISIETPNMSIQRNCPPTSSRNKDS